MIKNLISILTFALFAFLFVASSSEKPVFESDWGVPGDVAQSEEMGYVYLRYEYSKYDQPEIDWNYARQKLLNKCKAWDYTGMLFDSKGERECIRKNDDGMCVRWRVVHRCECVKDTMDINFAVNKKPFTTGTGVAIGNEGFIATSHYVADSASGFTVKGVNGSFIRTYSAEMVLKDKYSDLAILKINDPSFDGFDKPVPFNIATSLQKVGTPVYALGYPSKVFSNTDLRMNEGVVNAQTGAEGEVSLYQTSLPFQAHFSGGPVFNDKGELIGLTSTQFTFYERYCHATKGSYLKTLLDLIAKDSSFAKRPDISSMTRAEQVKVLRDFTVMIDRID